MYQNFLEYATQLSQTQDTDQTIPAQDQVLQTALHFFGKWDQYQSIVRTARAHEHLKRVFNGKIVGEWTGFDGILIKFVMDGVRERLGMVHPSNSSSQGDSQAKDGAACGLQRDSCIELSDYGNMQLIVTQY